MVPMNYISRCIDLACWFLGHSCLLENKLLVGRSFDDDRRFDRLHRRCSCLYRCHDTVVVSNVPWWVSAEVADEACCTQNVSKD